MSVTPLPASNTKRYFLHYRVNDVDHTLMMRVGSSKTDAQTSAVFEGLLDALASGLYNVTISSMEVAQVGEDIRNPATYTGATSFGTGNNNDAVTRAQAYSFTGRDSAGHKVKFFVFGAKVANEGDYRLDPTEAAIIDDTLTYLASLNGFFLTINESTTTWNQYANLTIPAYWQHALR